MFYKKKIKPTLEPKFRPFVINNQCGIVNIELINKRYFYDTTWCITMIISSDKYSIKIDKIKIVRYDNENLFSLINEIKSCKSIDEVKKLNMIEKIYYD